MFLTVNNNPNIKYQSFRAQDQQRSYNYSPVQNSAYQNQNQKGKKHITSQQVAAYVTIGASALMFMFFGRALLAEFKMSRALKKANKEIMKDLNKPTAKSMLDVINDCPEPTLKRKALEEYNKGVMSSQKRINDLLALADLSNAKPEEVNLKSFIELMDERIVGMEDVREKVLDFLIDYNYNIRNGIKQEKPLVLCLNGPPGTGKTTISEVLADAMGMHYKKINLNGANGKAPIKGYEAVYTGASCGGIAQGQLDSKTKRVLYCLDEVDKTASSNYNGKVEDTLLPLFDDQALFIDDNLDVPIDIKNSMFILTTNEFEKLSTPLQNRLERIDIKPYDIKTKADIAKLHLEKALIDKHLDTKVTMPAKKSTEEDSVYRELAEMTTDQGGRQVKQNVTDLVHKIIAKIMLGETNGKPVEVTSDFVKKELGPLSNRKSTIERVKNSKEYFEPNPNPQVRVQTA